MNKANEKDHLERSVRKAKLNTDALTSIRSWVAEQLAAHEYAKLEQGGHTNTQIPLRSVFIDLPISESPAAQEHRGSRRPFLDGLLKSKPVKLARRIESLAMGRVLQSGAGDEASKNSQESLGISKGTNDAILLIGGPGQGKSTLGQLACQLHRSILIRPFLNELPTSTQEIVKSFTNRRQSKNLQSGDETTFLPKSPLIPIQVSLPELAVWLGTQAQPRESNIPSIINFVTSTPSAKQNGVTAEMLAELISHSPSIIVLDGLDEVGAAEDRERIVESSRRMFAYLASRNASAQILATTRPQGYSEELSQVGLNFTKFYLSPLNKLEAISYAEKLIAAKMQGADQRQKAVD
ncbi:NACHT domain-containing protein [Dokdonella sp. MW10]|uniref:NACHT domain-containing protein n=1 Tax=Dokdonella sp. MW10 TaxID=2992926 RepID=UPI003F7E6297